MLLHQNLPMNHRVNVPETFRTKDATALGGKKNVYENPWVETDTGLLLNAVLFRKSSNERYLSQSLDFENAEKKYFYRQCKHN